MTSDHKCRRCNAIGPRNIGEPIPILIHPVSRHATRPSCTHTRARNSLPPQRIGGIIIILRDKVTGGGRLNRRYHPIDTRSSRSRDRIMGLEPYDPRGRSAPRPKRARPDFFWCYQATNVQRGSPANSFSEACPRLSADYGISHFSTNRPNALSFSALSSGLAWRMLAHAALRSSVTLQTTKNDSQTRVYTGAEGEIRGLVRGERWTGSLVRN